MSVTHIGAELRRLIVERANGVCEYCLIAEADTFFGCEIDHIVSEKHGGPTIEGNLSYACVCCNQAKGSDVGSIHWETNTLVRFFNPRTDRWAEHFAISQDRIEPRTIVGAVTARILGFNSAKRTLEREALTAVGRFPSAEASKRISG